MDQDLSLTICWNYKINQNQRCRKAFLSINKKVYSVCVIVQTVCPHRATERFGFSGLGNGCIFLNQKQFFILSPMEPTSPMALFQNQTHRCLTITYLIVQHRSPPVYGHCPNRHVRTRPPTSAWLSSRLGSDQLLESHHMSDNSNFQHSWPLSYFQEVLEL